MTTSTRGRRSGQGCPEPEGSQCAQPRLSLASRWQLFTAHQRVKLHLNKLLTKLLSAELSAVRLPRQPVQSGHRLEAMVPEHTLLITSWGCLGLSVEV